MDLFIARQPATQTTRKAVLLEASEAAGIPPRPNWIHPSPREFLKEFTLFAAAHDYLIGDQLPHPLIPGTQTTYTTAKSWPVTDRGTGRSAVITWDSLTGEIHGELRGAAWQPLVDWMPEIISSAYDAAEILHNNVIDQIAIAFMKAHPSAPYVSSGLPGKQRNSLWLAVPVDLQVNAETFFRTLGRPLLDGMTIKSSPLDRIVASCGRGCARLARGSGYRTICKRSHQALLDLMR